MNRSLMQYLLLLVFTLVSCSSGQHCVPPQGYINEVGQEIITSEWQPWDGSNTTFFLNNQGEVLFGINDEELFIEYPSYIYTELVQIADKDGSLTHVSWVSNNTQIGHLFVYACSFDTLFYTTSAETFEEIY